MTKEHLEKIQNDVELWPEDRAFIHYTKPYDIFNESERKELERVLLTLSDLAS